LLQAVLMDEPIKLEDLRATVSESKNDIARTLRAVAHPKRLEILTILADNSKSFVEILRATEISRTALANHLTQLISRGLVERIERGAYQVSTDGRELLQTIVESYVDSQIRVANGRRRMMDRYAGLRTGSGRMKKLTKLRFKPHYVSHLGCLDGCMEYLGLDVSTPWLYGVTGHGFILNIAQDLCPSGPTAWKTRMIFEMSRNLGAKLDGLIAWKGAPDFEEKQERAWKLVRKAIDAEQPCYGWQIGEIAEYYTIYGYDDVGYYYKGYHTEDGAGPKPWKEVGMTGVTLLEIYSVKKVKPSEDKITLKQAFRNVLKHASNPKDWIQYPQYKSGLEGYDAWIKAVESGVAITFGLAYNAAVWAECRIMAVEFLKEAQDRLDGELKTIFEKGIGYYDAVSRNLVKVNKLIPFSSDLTMDPIKVNDQSRAIVEALNDAREAEAKGLQVLEKIVEVL
ncbi:MAG: ArsR/SmtB family transcription factor, partial [Candidatus Hermodarchaeota archaeon]